MKNSKTLPSPKNMFTSGLPGKKWHMILLCSLVLTVGSAIISETTLRAETRYVQPSSEIAVRRGQGNSFKIIAITKSGSAVELLEESETHALVRLANGKEGWMLKRFLSSTPPSDVLVKSLQAEVAEVSAREKSAAEKLEEITSALNSAQTELSQTIIERESAKTAYQELQENTADVIGIQEKLALAEKQNITLEQDLAASKQANEKLAKDFKVKWFLAGAGVLLLGMILGRISSSSRRRKSSLL